MHCVRVVMLCGCVLCIAFVVCLRLCVCVCGLCVCGCVFVMLCAGGCVCD